MIIALADVLSLIKIQEDRYFLLAHREKGRLGTFSGEDKNLSIREAVAEKKRLQEKKRKLKSVIECEASTSKAILPSVSSGTSSGNVSTDRDDDEVVFHTGQKKAKVGKANVISQDLAATLDCTQVSDRKVSMIITAAVRSVGANPAELNVNRASIRRQRQKNRESFAKNLDPKLKRDVPLTVQSVCIGMVN